MISNGKTIIKNRTFTYIGAVHQYFKDKNLVIDNLSGPEEGQLEHELKPYEDGIRTCYKINLVGTLVQAFLGVVAIVIPNYWVPALEGIGGTQITKYVNNYEGRKHLNDAYEILSKYLAKAEPKEKITDSLCPTMFI
ncbi:Uncharacterised protein [Candidatus Tiddalikarchaeum anstoanum]|nr:Uncharacterised protein [Candidatus Tiddalikarchaeum anstoanum]